MPAHISRDAALAAGLPRYFTGKPCSRGGIGERLASNRKCVCLLCKATGTDSREASRSRYARNRESQIAKMRQRYLEDPKKFNARAKAWKQKNRAAVRAADLAWALKNPGLANARRSRYRASVLRAIPAWFGEFDELTINEAGILCQMRANIVGGQWHVDHRIPLQGKESCGLHCAANLQVIPAFLNQRK